MALTVNEFQTKTTRYELSGDLEARELFPVLLPNSQAFKAIDEDEPIVEEEGGDSEDWGPVPGVPRAMRADVAEFTKSALAEFHDEALAAAKAVLQAGQALLRKNFKEEEVVVLQEAAEALGVTILWDSGSPADTDAA